MIARTKKWGAACAVWGLFLLVGCHDGPPLGRVSGTVTWQGKPLANATVAFTPENGRSAHARTAEDGSYSLQFADGREGAEVGDNAVTIETFRISLDADGNPVEHPEILPAWCHAESKIVRTVADGANTFDFELKKDAPLGE